MTASLWDQFVAGSGRDAATLSESVGDRGVLGGLGYIAFRIALSSLGIGAEPIGKLAIAVE
nr:hypothetical protein [Deltaproteobacteria bacterium]